MLGHEASTTDNTIRGKISWRKVYGEPKRNPGEGTGSNEPGTWLQYVFEVQAYVQTVEQKTFQGNQKPEVTILLNPDPFAVSSIVKADDTPEERTVHYLIRLAGSVCPHPIRRYLFLRPPTLVREAVEAALPYRAAREVAAAEGHPRQGRTYEIREATRCRRSLRIIFVLDRYHGGRSRSLAGGHVPTAKRRIARVHHYGRREPRMCILRWKELPVGPEDE
jgi:hypothetical protein